MMTPMSRVIAAVFLALAASLPAGAASGDGGHTERQDWPFGGFSGQFDQAQSQRGFQVYQERCSGCHGLRRLSFRNLVQEGGPEFSEEAVKALAAAWPNKPLDIDDAGKQIERLPTLADPILGPYRNDKEARANQNNGALPPDLSVITKARNAESRAIFYVHALQMLRDIATGYQEGGADYVYSVLTGYRDVPKYVALPEGQLVALAAGASGAKPLECASVVRGDEGEPDACVPMAENTHYNAAFPGHQIAMFPPLAKDNFVAYQDGSGSFEQSARDVTAFLAWAGDPHLDARKQIGWSAMLYLLIMAALLFLAKTRIWREAH